MSILGSIFDAVGGFFGHSAQKKQTKKIIGDYQGARDQSVTGYQNALDTALPVFQNSLNAGVEAYRPYSEAGASALQRNTQMQTPGFEYSPSDPSYNFRLRENENALMRQRVATGGAQSGGTLKALSRYSQDYAGTEFANDFARNNQLAGLGMQGAQGTAGAYDNYGRYVGNALFQNAQGQADSRFKAADGMSGARSDRGDAIAAQWGDGANLATSVAKFFF